MAERSPRIMIIAGEASGDLQGACLAQGIRRALPYAEIMGIGGCRMRDAGITLIEDSSSWSAIGITEAVKLVPRLLAALHRTKAHLAKTPPDLMVLVDFGAFNVRLRRSVHLPDTKTLYYFPPGSWKRNADHSALKGIVDRIVTPFPWSAENLRNQGFSADFFGHPLLDTTTPSSTRDDFCARFGFDPEKHIIGLLPGSRTHEVIRHVPAIIAAVNILRAQIPDLQFAVPVAPSISAGALAAEMRRVPGIAAGSFIDYTYEAGDTGTDGKSVLGSRLDSAPSRSDDQSGSRIRLLPGLATDLLYHARAAIVTSGTATVEAAILGCPMVIIYKVSSLAKLEYRLLGLKIKFIGMPNIILDREACPELIQDRATPQRIAAKMLPLIQETPARREMLESLRDVKNMLGEPGAVEKTVNVCMEMLDAQSSRVETHND